MGDSVSIKCYKANFIATRPLEAKQPQCRKGRNHPDELNERCVNVNEEDYVVGLLIPHFVWILDRA